MSELGNTRAKTEPAELWRQWHDAFFQVWSNMLRGDRETFVDPYGLYRQWLENLGSTRDRARQAPDGPPSPYDMWQWWTDATAEAWRRAAEIGTLMTESAPRWLEMTGELQKQMLGEGKLPTDPMDFYLKLYNATSGPLSEIATDVLRNELFLEDSRRLFTLYGAFYNVFRRVSEGYFSSLQLPTSSDVYRVAELVVDLDDKVDRIEETFEDFEHGYKEPATAEAVAALDERLGEVEKRLERLDHVERKLDELLETLNAMANGGSQTGTGASQIESRTTES